MRNKKNINYICEVNYPTSSAYSLHVLKMCDALADNCKVTLYVPFTEYSEKKLTKNYLLKNQIKIVKIFNKRKELNFVNRLIFSIKIIKELKKNHIDNSLCLSRSIIFSVISSILNLNTIVEIHHELSGLTNKLFNFLKTFGYLKNLKYIFIHRNLVKKIRPPKGSFICLDDAVDVRNFKNFKSKIIQNTCVYIGSFHKGKGLEKIIKISKKLNKIHFHLYGDKKFLKNKNIPENIKIFDFISYKHIPKTLSKYKVALMPYENSVSGRLSNINLVKTMSPMKMFDYLASSKIILASDLKVYKHILKHKFNSILIKNDINEWIIWINRIFNSNKKMNYLATNARKTSLKYTWQNRSKKILVFSNKNFNFK